MALFEILRVSLAPAAELPLFEQAGINPEVITRNRYFELALTERHMFLHRRRAYFYMPVTQQDEVYAGVIGRQLSEVVNDGPESNFALMEQKRWIVAFLFFDAADTRQKAALQRNQRVGSPRGLLESFFEHVSEQSSLRYWKPYTEFISSKSDFWKATEEYRGQITSLNFKFLPPNVLGLGQAINDLVREATIGAPNAEHVDLKLINKNGQINPAGELVESGLNTATLGGGEVNMKVGTKVIYSSSKNRETQEVEKDDIPSPSAKDRVIALAKRLLGTKK